MPNFARFLVNILLYIFYTIVIAFLLWFIVPLILVSVGREIPILSSEEYNLIFFIIAGLVFVLTLLFRRSCYMSFISEDSIELTESYTYKKKQEWVKKTKKDTQKNTDTSTHEQSDGIKIYVDKEIK